MATSPMSADRQVLLRTVLADCDAQSASYACCIRRDSMLHSSPFVLGSSSRMRSSREHAPRMARANALKIASILW